MSLDTIADIFRDYWYIFIILGLLIFGALLGYVLYVQYGVYVEPLIKSWSESKTKEIIEYDYATLYDTMKTKYNCTCTCGGS